MDFVVRMAELHHAASRKRLKASAGIQGLLSWSKLAPEVQSDLIQDMREAALDFAAAVERIEIEKGYITAADIRRLVGG